MRRILLLVVTFLTLSLFIITSISAQVVSERKEIAVFKLSYYRFDIPEAVLGGIDEEIRSVFINLGRFDVVGLTQRLEEGDLNEFIDKIKMYKEEQVEIPEEVQMGKEFFTKADFDSLVGSFLVVVPAVANYVVAHLDTDEYQVNIKTSFSFINVEEGRTFAHAFVDTEGKDTNVDLAIKDALDAIPMQLTFEIRKIPEFQLKTGILEVRGSEIIIELGRDLGLKRGDEYVIVSGEILQSGKALTVENGLVVIKEVSDEVSVAKIIYARPRPQIGDQLQEVPRFGMDTTPYVHFAKGLVYDRDSTIVIGARQALSRGFYSFRPFAGIEVPLVANILAGIPLNLYIGGEYNIYLGRFQLVPRAAFGGGGAYLWYRDVPDEDKFLWTYVGGNAGISLNYLFHKNYRFSIEAGYLHWFSLVPLKNVYIFEGKFLFPDYDGLFVGAGVTIKY
ncbi:MAG: hypothetical protein V3V57_12475 [Spirochaetia bacterium]